ncbi:ubiquitin carboxyl-terminal hydrolase 20-like isoform X3 [Pomacea canaliculata]|uniref:ubiquitin carboxyl-terminal hydrolase 20-like isoform X3 n=1 Tax=Pomacea canaliculata TaxID=400727 RepID=UPI000D73E9F3|nr:ubiquitin carboxyl-terminal hydrolase 20-like isoform X3 [Pomacea canaliculata]
MDSSRTEPQRPQVKSWCQHVRTLSPALCWEEVIRRQRGQECDVCHAQGPNLWLCLARGCSSIGCGENVQDHSTIHAKEHCHHVLVNLTTLRLWCYGCDSEVFPGQNNPPFNIPEVLPANGLTPCVHAESSNCSTPQRSISGGDDSESDMDDENARPRGLTGLQNLGNTCYLNSAIQALSNCPPLTRFFLDCPGYVRTEKSPMLSKGYQKLVSEIWHKKRPSYVVPSNIVSGIKVVHPMFRGYTQQDAQEFLRCFMDQLHEELKYPAPSTDTEDDNDDEEEDIEELESGIASPSELDSHSLACGDGDAGEGRRACEHHRQNSMDSSSSQSECDYETCDSGLSSERGSQADHSMSGDENSDVNEHTLCLPNGVLNGGNGGAGGTGNNSIIKQSPLSQPRNNKNRNSYASQTWNTSTDDSVDKVANLKEIKETANLLSKIETENARHQGCSGDRLHKSESGVKKNMQYESVISHIFDGKILSSVQCLYCERVSTTKETFQDLSLPIPTKDHLQVLHSGHPLTVPVGGAMVGPRGGTCGDQLGSQSWLSRMFSWMKSWFVGPTITLQHCLSAFFSADELKGDNMYSCEQCKKLRNGLKYSKVLKLPEILCIHLKRFRHEFFSSKISSYISFPLHGLEMKPYLHKDCKSEITTYDLVAVVCHHGTAGDIQVKWLCCVAAGHYTAYCLNHVNEQWYEYDDQYVTEVDVSQVINSEAYVLFYRKSDEHMVSLRMKAMQLRDAHEPSLLQFYVSKQWINRFNTFAEPGPITNTDFLCKHGGVPPNKVSHVEELVEPLEQSVWELLYKKFGGGPVCNRLYACQVCQQELEKLRTRQKNEMDSFIMLNEKFQAEENHQPHIYAMSMAWFRQWEAFVRGKTDTPPGMIDNSRIASYRGGQPYVRPSSDYGQLSHDMWTFLHNIYGGGPELIIRQRTLSSSSATSPAASPAISSTGSPSSTIKETSAVSSSSPPPLMPSAPCQPAASSITSTPSDDSATLALSASPSPSDDGSSSEHVPVAADKTRGPPTSSSSSSSTITPSMSPSKSSTNTSVKHTHAEEADTADGHVTECTEEGELRTSSGVFITQQELKGIPQPMDVTRL